MTALGVALDLAGIGGLRCLIPSPRLASPRLADDASVEIIASPWKRWGKNRTYLNGADETRLGYFDHQTGELTVEVDAARAELEAWVARDTPEGVAVEAEKSVVEAAPPIEAVTLAKGSPRHALVPALAPTPSPLTSRYRVPGALAAREGSDPSC